MQVEKDRLNQITGFIYSNTAQKRDIFKFD